MTHESPGLVSIQSGNSVKVTIDRLEAMLKNKGITVFARIDHAAAAAAVGMPLRPTELLIFGDPAAGTRLMQAGQTIGIDLPLKALVGKMQTVESGSPTMIQHGWRCGTGSATTWRMLSTPRRASLPTP